jgi:hypothetical protein
MIYTKTFDHLLHILFVVSIVWFWMGSLLVCPVMTIAFVCSNDYSTHKIFDFLFALFLFLPYSFFGPLLFFLTYYYGYYRNGVLRYCGTILTAFLGFVMLYFMYYESRCSLMEIVILFVPIMASLMQMLKLFVNDIDKKRYFNLLIPFLGGCFHLLICWLLSLSTGVTVQEF